MEQKLRREVRTMSGVAGAKAYLDELFEIYPPETPIERVCALELVRRFAMDYGAAIEYLEGRRQERKKTASAHEATGGR